MNARLKFLLPRSSPSPGTGRQFVWPISQRSPDALNCRKGIVFMMEVLVTIIVLSIAASLAIKTIRYQLTDIRRSRGQAIGLIELDNHLESMVGLSGMDSDSIKQSLEDASTSWDNDVTWTIEPFETQGERGTYVQIARIVDEQVVTRNWWSMEVAER